MKNFMYKFKLNAPSEIENILDMAIQSPLVIINDGPTSTKFGRYTKELRDKGVLHISQDHKYLETTVILKVNNFYKPNNVKKIRGKQTVYIFQDTLIPNITLPKF